MFLLSKALKTTGFSSLLLISILCFSTRAFGDLLFFNATGDKQVYAKNPQKYDRIVLGSIKEEIFVERTPALRIELKEIQSVVIEREKVYKDTQTALEELFGITKGTEKKDGKNSDFT